MAASKKESERARKAAELAKRDADVQADGSRRSSPDRLWAFMGRKGLLGWSIPAAYGGEGARYSDIRPAVEALVRRGGRPGLALSWAVHLIVGKTLIADCGARRQKKEILPAMASGNMTVSIALSEPGAGSDPKRMRTTAVRKGSGYVLDGEKAWLTNGPAADLFVVFAVKGQRGGRKGFTEFVVPRESPGLSVQGAPPLGCLEPAAHCTIRLDRCFVPATAVLGRKGRAWEDLSKPFRVVEDVLLAGGAVLGGLDRQLERLIRQWRECPGKTAVEAEERIGESAALLEAARLIAREAARALDGRTRSAGVERRLASLHLLATRCRESLRGAFETMGHETPDDLGKDIDTLMALGVPASRARRRNWGYALLNGKERS